MPNRALVANDWMVFIDGVQVPFLNFQITFPVSGISSGSLTLEPDALLTRVRPRSVVAIFARDRFDYRDYTSDEERRLSSYFYYGGGEVVQVNNTREAQSRSTTLTFESDFSVFAQHSAFASGVGGAPFYGTINGSTFVRPEDVAGSGYPSDILSIATLAKTFSTGEPAPAGGVHRSKADGTEDFGNRLTELISFLSAHNASLRVQIARTRLLNKLAAIDDNTLSQLARLSIAGHLFNLVQNKTTSTDSIYQVIMKFAQQVNYRMATMPAPAVPSTQPPPGSSEKVPFPPHLSGDGSDLEIFKHRREWYRNDYVFMPNLFYSAPPPCNFIFPDMLGARSTTRNFMSEPTRSHYTDTVFNLGASLVYVEPAGIIDQDEASLLTPVDFWGLYRDLLRPNEEDSSAKDSPYRGASSLTSSGTDLLDRLLDEEIEKGIISQATPPHGEYVMALARFLAMKNPDGSFDEDKLSEIASTVADAFSEGDEKDEEGVRSRDYVRFVQLWLRYHHQLRRYNRPSQLQLKGHRWLVPGFSTVIFDQDMVFLSYVQSLTYIVGPDGSEATSVTLDHTRPIQTSRVSEITGLNATINDVVRIRETLANRIETQFDADSAAYRAQLSRMSNNRVKIEARREEFEAASSSAQGEILRELYSAIQSYEQDYASIMLKAREIADAAGGPGKAIPGAVLNRRDPDLVTALLSYLDPAAEIVDPAALGVILESFTQAQTAVSLIEQFNRAQVRQFRDGLPTHGTNAFLVDLINQAQEQKRQQGLELEKQIQELERTADFPTPPIFYNDEFMSLEKLDERYQDLLGCQPFYTGPYSEGIDPSLPDTEDKDIRRATAYLEHQKMLLMFGRVFDGVRRITASLEESVRDTGSATPNERVFVIPDRDAEETSQMSWEEAAQSELGSFRWQHENFLKRSAQTLGSYLRTHGFEPELETQISDEPDPTKFYRMVPRDPQEIGTLVWDESVVCRLVDEARRTGEAIIYESSDPTVISITAIDSSITPLDGVAAGPVYLKTVRITGEEEIIPLDEADFEGTISVPNEDPLVHRRREAAINPFLASPARQGVILAYARRHFGSRGFDGK